MPRFTLLVLVLVGLALPAFAGDGVVEINQAKALAGGVTASDAPGFPVTIDNGGSYKLTGNVTNLNPNVHTFELKASLITLDLNGFVVGGPTQCSFTPSGVNCDAIGVGDAIHGFTGCPFGNTVKNGTVYAAADDGISLCASSRVEDVQVIGANHVGISVEVGSTVYRSSVVLAGTVGIQARDSNVFDSMVRASGRDGDSFISGITGWPNVVAVRNNQIQGVYANQYFENHRVLGPNLCDGTGC